MKESYEALEMEVIVFDGDVFTDDVVPASNNPSVLAGG